MQEGIYILVEHEIQRSKKDSFKGGEEERKHRDECAEGHFKGKNEFFHLKFLPIIALASSEVIKSQMITPRELHSDSDESKLLISLFIA